MSDLDSKSHKLLLQTLSISLHYLSLFEDELELIRRRPSVLSPILSPLIVKVEVVQLLDEITKLDRQRELVQSAFWYENTAFAYLNTTIDIVKTWVDMIDELINYSYSKEMILRILRDAKKHDFKILVNSFTSLIEFNDSVRTADTDYRKLYKPEYQSAILEGAYVDNSDDLLVELEQLKKQSGMNPQRLAKHFLGQDNPKSQTSTLSEEQSLSQFDSQSLIVSDSEMMLHSESEGLLQMANPRRYQRQFKGLSLSGSSSVDSKESVTSKAKLKALAESDLTAKQKRKTAETAPQKVQEKLSRKEKKRRQKANELRGKHQAKASQKKPSSLSQSSVEKSQSSSIVDSHSREKFVSSTFSIADRHKNSVSLSETPVFISQTSLKESSSRLTSSSESISFVNSSTSLSFSQLESQSYVLSASSMAAMSSEQSEERLQTSVTLESSLVRESESLSQSKVDDIDLVALENLEPSTEVLVEQVTVRRKRLSLWTRLWREARENLSFDFFSDFRNQSEDNTDETDNFDFLTSPVRDVEPVLSESSSQQDVFLFSDQRDSLSHSEDQGSANAKVSQAPSFDVETQIFTSLLASSERETYQQSSVQSSDSHLQALRERLNAKKAEARSNLAKDSSTYSKKSSESPAGLTSAEIERSIVQSISESLASSELFFQSSRHQNSESESLVLRETRDLSYTFMGVSSFGEIFQSADLGLTSESSALSGDSLNNYIKHCLFDLAPSQVFVVDPEGSLESLVSSYLGFKHFSYVNTMESLLEEVGQLASTTDDFLIYPSQLSHNGRFYKELTQLKQAFPNLRLQAFLS